MPSQSNHGIDGSKPVLPPIRTLNVLPLISSRQNYDNLPCIQLNFVSTSQVCGIRILTPPFQNPTSTDSRHIHSRQVSSSSSCTSTSESASCTASSAPSRPFEPVASTSSAPDPTTYCLEPCAIDKADAVIVTHYASPANRQSPSANSNEPANAPKRNPSSSPKPLFLVGPAFHQFRNSVGSRPLTTGVRVHPYKIMRSNCTDRTKQKTGD